MLVTKVPLCGSLKAAPLRIGQDPVDYYGSMENVRPSTHCALAFLTDHP